MNKNKETKKIFIFSRLNKYFIFPFLVPILNLYPSLIIKYIINHYDLKNTEYLKSIYICSSLILGGLFYFITLIKVKKDKEEKKVKENTQSSSIKIELIYNSAEDITINNKKKYLILIIMSILFSSEVFFNQIYASKYNILDSRFYEILFICYLSKIILKINIFRHQKFSIILAFFGFICIFISIFPTMTKNDTIINILVIIKSLSYSIFLVLVKYLTCRFFLSPYLCCLLIGNFSTILLFIFLMLHSYFTKNDLSNLSYSLNFSGINNKSKFYILLISSFLVYSLTQFFTYMTVYYFSPMVFLMTQIVFPLIIWVINIVQDSSKLFEMIFTGIGYLILLIAILIYHEIIILNFCDLNKNTRKFIEEREKHEIISRDDENNNEINNSRRFSSYENNEDNSKDDISDN